MCQLFFELKWCSGAQSPAELSPGRPSVASALTARPGDSGGARCTHLLFHHRESCKQLYSAVELLKNPSFYPFSKETQVELAVLYFPGGRRRVWEPSLPWLDAPPLCCIARVSTPRNGGFGNRLFQKNRSNVWGICKAHTVH